MKQRMISAAVALVILAGVFAFYETFVLNIAGLVLSTVAGFQTGHSGCRSGGVQQSFPAVWRSCGRTELSSGRKAGFVDETTHDIRRRCIGNPGGSICFLRDICAEYCCFAD